ncbi:MAG: restriction endonuclease [Brevinema sp.]
MALPKQGELKKPIFEIIQKNPGVSLQKIYLEIPKIFELTDEEKLIPISDGSEPKINNDIRFAIMKLKKDELIQATGKGIYETIEHDKDILQSLFEDTLATSDISNIEEESSDEEKNLNISVDGHYTQIDNDLLDILINNGDNNTKGQNFEKFSLELLEAMGYGKAIRNGGTGDGGIDGYLHKDELGFERIGVQCKCYKKENRVNASHISKFAIDLQHEQCTQGIFITTSSFEKGATEQLKKIKEVKIILINGKDLAKYAREYKIGIKVEETIYRYSIDL